LSWAEMAYVVSVERKHLHETLRSLGMELQQWQGNCTGGCP